MIEPTCTGPNQTQPESTASSEAGLEDQSSLPATLVSERRGERATHETNSSLSALSSPTDLGSGVGVCVGVCVSVTDEYFIADKDILFGTNYLVSEVEEGFFLCKEEFWFEK